MNAEIRLHLICSRGWLSLRRHVFSLVVAALGVLPVFTLAQGDFQGSTHLTPFDEDTIAYSKSSATDVVAHLQTKISEGKVQFQFDPQFGYLKSLLASLDVPASSQMLVFSKTSLQRERISPATPRALFFNERVYVGYVPGSPLLELATVDPKLGAVFYTLEQKPVSRPQFSRNDQCLECHASAKSMGVPGHLVRSFATDESGVVDLRTGTSLVNHRTPLADRWGGWYVTGTHGSQVHRGNLIGAAAFARQAAEPNHAGNRTNLASLFDVTQHLKNQSDIVALMVFEHQAHLHNFITRLQYEATIALAQYGHVNYLKNMVTSFLKYVLFTEEARLTAPITGSPQFLQEFTAVGPRDKKGRSLRDFDLRTRLFRYPCSYVLYSDAFDALPEPLKKVILTRLGDILLGRDANPDFAEIAPETRQAIHEILRETKTGLPDSWSAERKVAAAPVAP